MKELFRTYFAVILAPAATGKSTIANKLFEDLLNRHGSSAVPLLVERVQWSTLQHQEDLTFAEIWQAAVHELYPRAIVNIDQLERCLTFGTICLIFDGLDELCTYFPTSFNPSDAVDELVSLYNEGEGFGRILLTSRTKFWCDNIKPAIRAKFVEIDLCPFTPGQRQEYILKRFPHQPEKQVKAQKILDRLAHLTYIKSLPYIDTSSMRLPIEYERVDLLPYVVMLATESADTDAPDIYEKFGHLLSADDPLEGLIVHFCERERERHHMTIPAEEQLLLFQELAAECGDRFDIEDLQIVIASHADHADNEAEQFKDHGLFDLTSDGRTFSFRFPFINEYLMSRVVRTWLLEDQNVTGIQHVLEACAVRPGTLIEKCSELVRRTSKNGWIDNAKARWRDIMSNGNKRVLSGAFHIFLELCKDESNRIRKDTTESFLSILGSYEDKTLRNLFVTGDINGMDFRDVGFYNCHFENIEFVNCQFNEGTKFDQCRFDGNLLLDSSAEFGAAELSGSCVLSPSARFAFQLEQKGRRKLPVTRDQIIQGLYEVLRKFVRGTMLRTRKQEGIHKVARSIPFGSEIINILRRTGVLEDFMSSSNKMYRITDSHRHDVYIFLVNRLCTGSIKNAEQTLEHELIVE